MEQFADAFGDRHRTLDRRRGGADLFGRQFVAVLQGVDHGLGLQVGLQRHGRGEQPHHHSGDRRMDTGLVQAQPQPDPGGDEDRRIGDVQAAQHGDRGDDGGGDQQVAGGEVVAVDDGDDDDGAEVVDDRQGEQEDLQRRRDPAPEQGHHPDGEGDVGGHRDAPPTAFGSAGVEGEVDQCGHDHAAEGGHRRQRGLAAVAQLADGPLAFDLQADDEEEDGHQPVVDDAVEVLGEMERPDGDVDRRRPQRLVAGAPRRVRPHQRHRRGHRQQHPTGRLDTQELGQRSSHPGQPAVTVQEGGRPQLPGGWRVHRWHGCPRDTSSEGLPTRLPGAPGATIDDRAPCSTPQRADRVTRAVQPRRHGVAPTGGHSDARHVWQS